MDDAQKFGFDGAALMAVGVFCPLVSVPIVGSITYFMDGDGDGRFLLGLAFCVALGAGLRKAGLVWLGALLGIALLAFSFANFRMRMAEFRGEIADNPLGAALSNVVQMQWGWAVMALGLALALAAAAKLRKAPAPARNSP